MTVLVSILTRPEGRVQLAEALRSLADITVVSILTRPEGRVQHEMPTARDRAGVGVSILTRPEGRVQLSHGDQIRLGPAFQSSPVPKDGCNEAVRAWLVAW